MQTHAARNANHQFRATQTISQRTATTAAHRLYESLHMTSRAMGMHVARASAAAPVARCTHTDAGPPGTTSLVQRARIAVADESATIMAIATQESCR
ncbi:hypothetical protein A9762_20920 [Pandoraea sp. ISTKB]|nr:hypothetical protein A9762_20920 [Pandoraea sp. ISTKB]